MHCPNCQSKRVGHIAPQQFYCWDCSVELFLDQGVITIHQIEADGSVTDITQVFSDEPLNAIQYGFNQ